MICLQCYLALERINRSINFMQLVYFHRDIWKVPSTNMMYIYITGYVIVRMYHCPRRHSEVGNPPMVPASCTKA